MSKWNPSVSYGYKKPTDRWDIRNYIIIEIYVSLKANLTKFSIKLDMLSIYLEKEGQKWIQKSNGGNFYFISAIY